MHNKQARKLNNPKQLVAGVSYNLMQLIFPGPVTQVITDVYVTVSAKTGLVHTWQ